MNTTRGSGRTYKIMEQMLDTILQHWVNPRYKYIFFISPTNTITKYNFREFAEKHLATAVEKDVWEFKYRNNSVTFINGVSILFINSKEPITEEVFYSTEKFRGMSGNMLFFEDHTVYEEALWRYNARGPEEFDSMETPFPEKHDKNYIERMNKISSEEFRRFYCGEWGRAEPNILEEICEKNVKHYKELVETNGGEIC